MFLAIRLRLFLLISTLFWSSTLSQSCWKDRLSIDCSLVGIDLQWDVIPPTSMFSNENPLIAFSLQLSNFTLTPSDGNEIPHANLHACERDIVDICEPFIKPIETGSISIVTHSQALAGNQTYYNGTLQLPKGVWEVIGHMYFFDVNASRYDVTITSNVTVSYETMVEEISISVRIVSLTSGSLLICLCIFFSIVTMIKRNERDFKAAAPVFLQLFLFGCLLVSAVLCLLFAPIANWVCVAEEWVFSVGFAFAFGALFIKNYRIYILFHKRMAVGSTPRAAPLSNIKLVSLLFAIIGIYIMYLVIWTAVDMASVEELTRLTENDILVISYQCATTTWTYVMLFLQLVLMIIGMVICLQLRHVPRQFNESKLIFAAIYNWSLLRILFVSISLLTDFSPNAGLILKVTFIWLTIPTMLCVMFIPKLLEHSRFKQDSNATMTMNELTAAKIPYEMLIEENAKLKKKVRSLTNQINGVDDEDEDDDERDNSNSKTLTRSVTNKSLSRPMSSGGLSYTAQRGI